MNLTSYLKETQELIERNLEAIIPEKDVPHTRLFQAARYSLIGGGKRLRPVLTLATAKIFGICPSKALNAACAIEMIHTYSLIHDDLPCMDDDDFRRGKPSLHKAFGEGHAVLAGDYLLTFAFEVIARDVNISAEQKVSLISLLAKNSGGNGMIGGQILDIEAEGKNLNLDGLRQIHRFKTGAMITTAIEFGAIIANANADQHKNLRQFGDDIGLAFQIIDDVLDITASKQKHGKEMASDAINKKATYVSLLGLENARQSAFELLESSQKHLKNIEVDTTLLHELATRLVHREF